MSNCKKNKKIWTSDLTCPFSLGIVYARLVLPDVSILLPAHVWGHWWWVALVLTRGGFPRSRIDGIGSLVHTATVAVSQKVKDCCVLSFCFFDRQMSGDLVKWIKTSTFAPPTLRWWPYLRKWMTRLYAKLLLSDTADASRCSATTTRRTAWSAVHCNESRRIGRFLSRLGMYSVSVSSGNDASRAASDWHKWTSL